MVWMSLIILCVVVWLGGYAVGGLLTRRTMAPIPDRALFAFPLGSAMIGWIEFCASEFGGIPITAPLLYIIAFPLAGAGAVILWQDVRRRRHSQENTSDTAEPQYPSPWTRFAWIELAIIVILFLRQTLESITEPYIGLDALRYHFPFAHIIFQSHALPQFASPSMGDLFFTSPPLPFLWYANIWLWVGTPHLFLPILTTVIISGHICILLYRMARRLIGVSPETALGMVLCLLLPGIFSNLLQILRSSTDIPFAFWGVATAYWWLQDSVERNAYRWAWVGLCGGLMAWIKPYGYVLGLAYVGIMVGWWVYYRNREQAWTYPLPAIGKVLALWTLVVLPLPLQHWLIWDNPVYPVFGRILGGILINDWSLQHSIMLLNVFAWDGYGIMSQLLSEPVVALGGVAILHPEVRKNPTLRLLWLIPFLYAVLYLIMFGSTISNLIPGAHARYQLPGIMLFGLFVSCFLDPKFLAAGKILQKMLLCALIVQAVLILYPLLSDGGILRGLSGQSDVLKILFYEWLALFLVIGFLAAGWTLQHANRLRLGLIGAGCVFLIYPWPLDAPWQLVSRPLASPLLEWTAKPVVSPHGPWIQANVPGTAVLLVDDDRRWLIPRQILPADSPLLAGVYASDVPLMKKLQRLAELGVTHIVTTGTQGQPAPLKTDWLAGAPSWDFLNEPEGNTLFTELYYGPPVSYSQDPVGFTSAETHLYRIEYPPELRRLCEAPLVRPWLYEYATNRHMGKRE